MVNALARRLSYNELRRHPLQLVLMLLSIAMGVAIVVAVDLANSSAKKAFQLSMDMTFGTATHSIMGGSPAVPEALYSRIRTDLGIRNSAPALTAEINIEGRSVSLIGIDPFAMPFNQAIQDSILNLDASARLLTEPGTGIMPERTAEAFNIQPGDMLAGTDGNRRVELRLIDISWDRATVDQDFVLVDIATAQELLGMEGFLDRIDLKLTAAQVAQVEASLANNLRLVTTERERNAAQQMTAAFHTNLAAMSLLALLVGVFLVYNSVSFSALRRREQFGIMRALGFSQKELLQSIIVETVVIALIATVLGALLGIALAQFLLTLMTLTINDLYYRLEVSELFITPIPIAKGLLLGVCFSGLAAVLPAREAARVPPVTLRSKTQLETKTRDVLFKLLLLGGACIAIGCALIFLAPDHILYGFIALALVIIGLSLTFSYLLQHIAKGLSTFPVITQSFIGKICLRGIKQNLSRLSAAVSALALAVATMIGVGLMIASFRFAVADWLDASLPGDLYVSAPSMEGAAGEQFLTPEFTQAITSHPMVKSHWQARFTEAETEFGTVSLLATERRNIGNRGFRLLSEERDKILNEFQQLQGVLVSEPLASHQNLSAGDHLSIDTYDGIKEFHILGVFEDYSSSRGLIVLPLDTYQRQWRDLGISSIGLVRKAHNSAGAFREAMQRVIDAHDKELRIRSNTEIKELSLAIFDRTFTITEVLRLLAVIVAFIGIVSSLLAVQMERKRDFALLRATGCTPAQIVTLVMAQTCLLGLVAALFALPLGMVMSNLLIYVINVRSFGWSMPQVYVLEPLVAGVLLSLTAAALAGLYPAIRAARTPIAQTLRQE